MSNRKKLIDLVPDHSQYAISKLYEGFHSGYPMVGADIKYLKNELEKIKRTLDSEYSSYKSIDGVGPAIESLDHILARLNEWSANENLKDNLDAKVFIDAFRWGLADISSMFRELDSAR